MKVFRVHNDVAHRSFIFFPLNFASRYQYNVFRVI